MRDIKKEQQKLQSRYRQHLNRIKSQYKFYDKELALLMGFNIDQADYVRQMRSGKAEIFTCDMITLSKNLILEHNDSSLLQEMVPDEFIGFAVSGGMTNGCVNDEINNITMYSGQILQEGLKDNPDSQFIVRKAEKIASESATIKNEVKS
ncbi:hypothetical protein [Gracilimonas sediminicola]|uniref:Uncharacterized protein n=1 Tax=Gracilimonas sediminicola TaxID=2952158 RepID=A0A9X2L0H1_9BACT|nr:hypothetical protein [Gracilimonas sediminicola]MCP9290045.1 hypothetical protein [Gracilimonas sediminicola]